jgi:peptidyl-prolyl cis-trans isomerase B (cyclophilin B)
MFKTGIPAVLVLAFAARAAAAQDLGIALAADKADYALGDDVQAEVTVTNGSDKAIDLAELVLEDRSVSFEVTFEAAPGKARTFVFGAVRPDPHVAERVGPSRAALRGKKSLGAVLRVPTLRPGPMTLTAVYRGGEKEIKSAPVSVKVGPGADGASRLSAAVSTSQGDFQIDLLPDEAPLAVSHFVLLAKRGFYNSLNVHRIIKNAWFQTGCPYDNGFGHAGFAYKSEAESQAAAHEAGTVAMCQNLKGGFAGSQFFVNAARQQAFDKKFAVFGRVPEAKLDVVKKIAGLETDKSSDRPLKEDVRIKEIRIVAVK